jgi:hypothetical protein
MIKAKLPEQHTDLKPADSKKKTVSIEQIEKLGKKISKMQEKYQKAESTYCAEMLNSIVTTRSGLLS